MRHIIPISGKDSLAAAIVQTAYQPDLPYEFIFNDTYVELPETYEWLDKAGQVLGKPIRRYGRDLREVIACEGMLPSPRVRFCTRLSKIAPMEKTLRTGESVTLYFGIRADEQGRIGYRPERRDISVCVKYPLIQFGMTLNDVLLLLARHDIAPPLFFWQSMYERVLQSLMFPALLENLSEWTKTTLFSWRSRSNCYFCFFQRQYEWIGLLEYHPDLFWNAVEIEESTTDDERREKAWHWRGDSSLRSLASRADEIKSKRAKTILNAIYGSALSDKVDDGDNVLTELDVTSCGLFCGK